MCQTPQSSTSCRGQCFARCTLSRISHTEQCLRCHVHRDMAPKRVHVKCAYQVSILHLCQLVSFCPCASRGMLSEILIFLAGFITSLLPAWNYNPDEAAAFAAAQLAEQQQQQAAAEGAGEIQCTRVVTLLQRSRCKSFCEDAQSATKLPPQPTSDRDRSLLRCCKIRNVQSVL